MTISTFFDDLNTAYQAELDDLRTDSDGKDVLRQRLQDKRAQLPFLCQMIESAPELVAVVFHGGFHFEGTQTLEHLLRQDADDLPGWDALAGVVRLTAWAQDLADVVLAHDGGDRLLVLAAALEYLQHRPNHEQRAGLHGDEPTQAAETDDRRSRGARHADDEDDAHDFDADPDAGEDWLQDQGFDRKD